MRLGWTDDRKRPVIKFGSATTNLTYDQLTLAFSTNEATTYRLEYVVADYDRKVEDLTTWAKGHRAVLRSLTPGSTVLYRIVAMDHRIDPDAAANEGVWEGSYTMPPAPTRPPVISAFTVSGVEGHKTNLAWSTDRPCVGTLTYWKSGGAVMTRSLDGYVVSRKFVLDLLEPSSTYTGTLEVRDAFGLESSCPFTFRTKATSTADVRITIDTTIKKPISPYIYGTNQNFGAPQYTFGRIGGNRRTTYNWTNNASNAGSDYYHQNDAYLPWIGGVPEDQYGVPGIAILQRLNQIFGAGSDASAALITVPIQGYVAADLGTNPNGDVALSGPDYLQTRFKQLRLTKGATFTLTPSTTEPYVYTDEFVNWLKTVAGPTHPGKQLLYSLDNEPDLWQGTHARVQPRLESYDSLCVKNEEAAKAIKEVDPDAEVFGFVSYGWYGYTYLQGAPDGSGSDHAAHGDFTEYYLERMKEAGERTGGRLVDVLDLHYYTEAQTATGGQRVGGQDTSAEAVAARVQSTRSLWDPSYVENSWITRDVLPEGDKAIRLIPRMQAKIETKYPGTKLAITEYNFGGGAHISGAIAQADALGIFGQTGVFAATHWQMFENEHFLEAAFKMYRGFDGNSANFGDMSLGTSSSDVSKVAVYASLDSAAPVPGRAVFVAINRTDAFQDVSLHNLPLQGIARIYRLDANSNEPAFVGEVPSKGPSLVVALPPMSISTLDIR